MNYMLKMIIVFAVMSASTAIAQTSVTQGGTSTSSVNPWVSAQKGAAINQVTPSEKGKKVEEATPNIWLNATKMNGQTTLQPKPAPQVVAKTNINPWMKPSELKTTDVPVNKK